MWSTTVTQVDLLSVRCVGHAMTRHTLKWSIQNWDPPSRKMRQNASIGCCINSKQKSYLTFVYTVTNRVVNTTKQYLKDQPITRKNAEWNTNDVKVGRFDFCFGQIFYFDENYIGREHSSSNFARQCWWQRIVYPTKEV